MAVVHRHHPRNLAAGIAGIVAVATILMATLYLSTAQGSSHAPATAAPAVAPHASDAATTFLAHAPVDGVAAEPDPSPRSVAAYSSDPQKKAPPEGGAPTRAAGRTAARHTKLTREIGKRGGTPPSIPNSPETPCTCTPHRPQ
jgi:hypothetical protein